MRTLLSLAIAALLAGCTAPSHRATPIDPFQVDFHGRARWTEGHKGFDPDLSGYHVTGDIASIVLRPRSAQLPDTMVIAITTSPGMRPRLEHFKVSTKDVTLSLALPAVRKGGYFQMTVLGKEVLVTFLPKAMALLEGDITITWIDYYRG